jgi:hypothetical protein
VYVSLPIVVLVIVLYGAISSAGASQIRAIPGLFTANYVSIVYVCVVCATLAYLIEKRYAQAFVYSKTLEWNTELVERDKARSQALLENIIPKSFVPILKKNGSFIRICPCVSVLIAYVIWL